MACAWISEKLNFSIKPASGFIRAFGCFDQRDNCINILDCAFQAFQNMRARLGLT